MLRWMGYKQVAVKTIVLPSDVKKRQKLPHVVELARSIAELGDEPIHAPTIAAKSKKLIAGRDRMAALLLNGVKSCWVRMADGTAKELADLEIDENLHRRQDDRDALIARRVNKVTAEVEAAGELPDTVSGKPGRKKTAHGQARERVARELGTTPEAIRAAEARAAAPDPVPMPQQVLPPVETWGIAETFFPQGELDAARRVQEVIDAADAKLKAAQGILSGLKDGCGQVGQRAYALLYEHVHQVADAVRRARPEYVCPYCKYVPSMRPTCPGCAGVGFTGPDSLEAVADELTHVDEYAVVVDGRGGFIPIAQARARNGGPPARGIVEQPAIRPQPKPVKKLQIQDGDGNPLNFEDDGIPF
ncbi:MAG TPA: ParB/RepB/Spo0J family partition protein [Thermomicrobiaceae bacterium]|nr:ParB/RepB/Spo0J family partition protein [Thermomicrobiaceae bacterium]